MLMHLREASSSSSLLASDACRCRRRRRGFFATFCATPAFVRCSFEESPARAARRVFLAMVFATPFSALRSRFSENGARVFGMSRRCFRAFSADVFPAKICRQPVRRHAAEFTPFSFRFLRRFHAARDAGSFRAAVSPPRPESAAAAARRHAFAPKALSSLRRAMRRHDFRAVDAPPRRLSLLPSSRGPRARPV